MPPLSFREKMKWNFKIKLWKVMELKNLQSFVVLTCLAFSHTASPLAEWCLFVIVFSNFRILLVKISQPFLSYGTFVTLKKSCGTPLTKMVQINTLQKKKAISGLLPHGRTSHLSSNRLDFEAPVTRRSKEFWKYCMSQIRTIGRNRMCENCRLLWVLCPKIGFRGCPKIGSI